MRLYQAEWCPFSHRVRAKLTELGINYEIVNVSASGKRRAELEEVAGTKVIPVLVDGDRIITDSDEAICYLEHSYETDPEELDLSSYTGSERSYKVLVAVDPEFMRLASKAAPGAAALALLETAVYEEDGLTRVDAIEPEKGVGQIRDPEVNDRGLKLRKRFIQTIKALQRSNVEA